MRDQEHQILVAFFVVVLVMFFICISKNEEPRQLKEQLYQREYQRILMEHKGK